AMQMANEAFHRYKKVSSAERVKFLRTISSQIDLLGEKLIHVAMEESHLPETRLRNERGRTTNQLNSFAALLEAGDWVQASIDQGDAERKPFPKPDLRKMFFPLGPVVVFGASNFPFAFSTAGGDTASALAAGCTVVVKSHPAHPRTSSLVACAIQQAIEICGLPENAFQHIEDTSIEAGRALVQHPHTKAASFTGSYQGGKALFDLATQRTEPIPFFAEMGSINPVVLLPKCIRQNKELPSTLASSITLGVGQFCTNPGLLLVMENEGLNSFLEVLSQKIAQVQPARMLHKGIAANYRHRKSESLVQQGVEKLAEVITSEEDAGSVTLALVTAKDFLQSEILKEEVFGPYSLIVKCRDEKELHKVINSLAGQLTATVFGEADELSNYNSIVDALQQRVGRLIFNGVPTGVEVCKSMQHGGPFPSTTDSRFTSVGVDAIYRFVRPISYQDSPNDLLPIELRNQNTANILRCINGTWTRDHL
ncbi:MAG: aldehyde dehydrogenase (NADP(+)), partial [Chryseolinea sp.]